MMSAKKVDGVRLYSLARQGIEIERKPQTVEVYTCRLESYDEQTGEGTLFCHVSKGTYIRSLCHDLGQQFLALFRGVGMRLPGFLGDSQIAEEAVLEANL